MVLPSGTAAATSNATSARRRAILAVTPENIEPPSPLLNEPFSLKSVVSRAAGTDTTSGSARAGRAAAAANITNAQTAPTGVTGVGREQDILPSAPSTFGRR